VAAVETVQPECLSSRGVAYIMSALPHVNDYLWMIVAWFRFLCSGRRFSSPTAKKESQNEPCDEASDVGHVGHATGFSRLRD